MLNSSKVWLFSPPLSFTYPSTGTLLSALSHNNKGNHEKLTETSAEERGGQLGQLHPFFSDKGAGQNSNILGRRLYKKSSAINNMRRALSTIQNFYLFLCSSLFSSSLFSLLGVFSCTCCKIQTTQCMNNM